MTNKYKFLDYQDDLPAYGTRRYFDEVPDSLDDEVLLQTTQCHDAPSTPHRQRPPAGNNINFQMSVEVPPDIASTTQIIWTMTPTGTPTHPMTNGVPRGTPTCPTANVVRSGLPICSTATNTPRSTPVRNTATECYVPNDPQSHLVTPPIPAPDFGPETLLSSQTLRPVLDVHELQSKHACGSVHAPTSDVRLAASPISTPASPPASPPPRTPRSARPTHHSTGTFGQSINIPINENIVCQLDPGLPIPVYPCVHGETHPDDPAPNNPIYLKKYYVVFKGLRPGVYYDEWRNVEPLCKNLKDGKGSWQGAPTLRQGIILYEKRDEKVVIPNIRHY